MVGHAVQPPLEVAGRTGQATPGQELERNTGAVGPHDLPT